jgi:hypothetical protein
MMPAAIGRDSTARYSAMRGSQGRVASYGARRTSSGSDGDLSLQSKLLPPDDRRAMKKSRRDGSTDGWPCLFLASQCSSRPALLLL